MKSKIIAAMDAAGYCFDELESTDDNLRFLGEGGTLMQMSDWKEAKEWLEGVVFDDSDVSDRVEKILHPEHFREKKPSVLKRLSEKKAEVREKNGKGLAKEKSKNAPHL